MTRHCSGAWEDKKKGQENNVNEFIELKTDTIIKKIILIETVYTQ